MDTSAPAGSDDAVAVAVQVLLPRSDDIDVPQAALDERQREFLQAAAQSHTTSQNRLARTWLMREMHTAGATWAPATRGRANERVVPRREETEEWLCSALRSWPDVLTELVARAQRAEITWVEAKQFAKDGVSPWRVPLPEAGSE